MAMDTRATAPWTYVSRSIDLAKHRRDPQCSEELEWNEWNDDEKVQRFNERLVHGEV